MVQVQGVSEEAYTAVVCQQEQDHLASHTKRVFDSPLLPAAQAYVAAVPLQFLRLLLSQVHSPTRNTNRVNTLADKGAKLCHFHVARTVLSMLREMASEVAVNLTCELNFACFVSLHVCPYYVVCLGINSTGNHTNQHRQDLKDQVQCDAFKLTAHFPNHVTSPGNVLLKKLSFKKGLGSMGMWCMLCAGTWAVQPAAVAEPAGLLRV